MAEIIRVIDLESSGLPEAEGGAGICEIGRCDVLRDAFGPWYVTDPWASLCNPGRPIPPEVRAIHHISDADVANAPQPDHFLGDMHAGEPMAFAAHFAKFERAFFDGGGTPWIDTWKVALRLWPDAPSHSNQTLRYFLGMELDPALAMPPHRAGPDAFVTAHLLAIELNDGRATFDDMVRWSSGPALLPRVKFGKHNGSKWEDVPTDYLDWVVNKSDMDSDIKANARHHLKKRATGGAEGPTHA